MAKINPALIVKKIFIYLIKLYQIIISPILGYGKCRFYPTCSNYALEAISKKGVVKGSLMALWRIMRCHPFSKSGFDPVDKSEK